MGWIDLWLADYGQAAAILLGALCLGYPVARRVLRGPAAVPLMVLIGLACLDLIVCLLAWLHIFGDISLIVVGILAVGASVTGLREDVPHWRGSRPSAAPRWPLLTCTGALLVVVVGLSWFVVYPVSTGDALNYHLPLAANLIAHHGLSYDPFIRFSFFPQGNEAIYAVVLLISRNGTGAAALEFAVLCVGGLALPAWFSGSGRRPAAGLLAGLVVLASPVVIWVATAPMVDAWTLTFILAATLVGLEAAEARIPSRAGFGLMGLLVGEAASAKYTGLAYGVFAVAGVLIAGGLPLVRTAIASCLAGAAMLIVPWYAWTLHTTGDPLYPFGTSIFGNRPGLWNSSEIQAQTISQRGLLQSSVSAIFSRDIQYLRGQVLYNTGPHRSPLSWWLGSGYLGLLLRRARRDRVFLGLAATGLASMAFDVTQSADPRMFVPAVGPLALLAGIAAQHLLDRLSPIRWSWPRSGRIAALWCAAAVAATIWTPAHYILWYRDTYGPPPATPAARVTYLSYFLPCYRAVLWLNQHAGSQYRAWGECAGTRYYARGVLIGDAFSIGASDRIFSGYPGSIPPPGILWARLEPLDVRWLILPAMPRPSRALLDRHGLFTFVASAGQEDVFRVMPVPS
jgi:hypothetical protein